jgi:hypothetical protein
MAQVDSGTGWSASHVVRGLALAGVLGIVACHAPIGLDGAPSGTIRSERVSRATYISPEDRQRGGGEHEASALPVFMISLGGARVASGRETPGLLRVIEDHDGPLADLAGRDVTMESGISLEIHGESSATLAKRSYRLELVDDKRGDRALPLLGLPAGSDWVLHSCGFDPACLRNVLVFALGRELGRYAPRTRFVEVFVDDDYQGLYVLIERVRRGKHRIDLPRPAEAPSDGDITGGYIFKMDLGEGTPADAVARDWVSPVSQAVYSYYYPRFDQITNAQKAYLRDHMSDFEALMRSPRWNDPQTGYRRWLDLASWVDFALIQELSLNPDAYFKSIYLQKWPRSMGDRIAIGPFWDFDLAFGVVDFRNGRNIHSWAHDMNRFGTQRVPYDPPGKAPYVPEFWERLWSDPAFHASLKCRWEQLREDLLHGDRLEAMIDRWFGQIAGALGRDWARWRELPKNSYHGADLTLKEFLRKRLAWMDAHLPGRCAAESPAPSQ